jgi:hypothetical protein
MGGGCKKYIGKKKSQNGIKKISGAKNLVQDIAERAKKKKNSKRAKII